MLKKFVFAAALAVIGTSSWACSPEEVEARQPALIGAVQQLLAVNPAKAQEIVVKMQQELDQALADGDDAATCRIMDEALASAQS